MSARVKKIKLVPTIIAATDDFVVLNKPHGLLVHEAESAPDEKTLVDWLLKKFPKIKKVGDEPKVRPGIVHRLDREASGLLLVALTPAMFEHLKNQFQEHTITKEYLVLVHGKVKNDWGEIKLPIMRQSHAGRMAARPVGNEEAKEAHTEYYVEQRFGSTTLLRVILHTGRTHQIRVHFYALGHPVVGDTLYEKRLHAKTFPVPPRLFLHAARLGFDDLQNQHQEFTVELPPELADYLKNFKKI